jgi:hypothetical protein
MSGWCLANLLPLAPRERLLCMAAATLPDLDGLGILISEHYYTEYHHVLGHNLTFGVVLAALLTAFSKRNRPLAFVAYLALFHLHLVMDYYGSGPGWYIPYLWPWRDGPDARWMHPAPWNFYSWQNLLAAFLFLLWTLGIAWRLKRTPLEAIMPPLDRQLVGLGPKREPAAIPD